MLLRLGVDSCYQSAVLSCPCCPSTFCVQLLRLVVLLNDRVVHTVMSYDKSGQGTPTKSVSCTLQPQFQGVSEASLKVNVEPTPSFSGSAKQGHLRSERGTFEA